MEREEASNLPLSEQFRIIAKQWVDQDNAASILEETKSVVLAERKNDLIKANPKMSDAAAERTARGNPEWKEFVVSMVEARTKANRLKVQLEYIRMKHGEQQSYEATKRQEMRL